MMLWIREEEVSGVIFLGGGEVGKRGGVGDIEDGILGDGDGGRGLFLGGKREM